MKLFFLAFSLLASQSAGEDSNSILLSQCRETMATCMRTAIEEEQIPVDSLIAAEQVSVSAKMEHSRSNVLFFSPFNMLSTLNLRWCSAVFLLSDESKANSRISTLVYSSIPSQFDLVCQLVIAYEACIALPACQHPAIQEENARFTAEMMAVSHRDFILQATPEDVERAGDDWGSCHTA